MPLVPLLCRTGSSLQLCCYYDYYDASAINGGGEEMVLAGGTYLCIMAVMAWRVPRSFPRACQGNIIYFLRRTRYHALRTALEKWVWVSRLYCSRASPVSALKAGMLDSTFLQPTTRSRGLILKPDPKPRPAGPGPEAQ